MNNANAIKNISILFKTTRKYYGLFQAEFASVLGVTQGTISKIEAGTMEPDIGIWFTMLRSFKILDPYCFTYSGLEFSSEAFEILKVNGSTLAPSFDFNELSICTDIRKIRPLFDYLLIKNTKALHNFLAVNKVSIEIFYILNHPVGLDFINAFFNCLDESKINSRSFSLLDLSFNSAMGKNLDALKVSEGSLDIVSSFTTCSSDFFSYEASKNKNEYFVNINKKDFSKLKNVDKSDFILDYNLLLPFHALKAIKGSASVPKIKSIKDNQKWQITYAS